MGFLLVLALSASSPAVAQDLESVIKPGDTVFITDRQGHETSGTLTLLSTDTLRIAAAGIEREVPRRDVGRVEKPDPLWNGALIGAGIFAFGFAGGSGASCSPRCGTAVPLGAIAGAGLGALLGAAIDKAIPGRSLVYESAEAGLPPRRGQYTAIGAAAGASAGLITALAGVCEDGNGHRDYVGCSCAGAVLGALIGRFVPRTITPVVTPNMQAVFFTVGLSKR